MAKNDYNNLEDQLGDAGGLGKIQHAEILGKKANLDEESQASLEAFKADIARHKNPEPVNISDGWVPVDKDLLDGRDMFYPIGYDFFIKPATVGAIRNWSAVNDTDLLQLNKCMNEILRSSVKISNGEASVPWSDIRSWDRFWFLMMVREHTFVKGENKITFEDQCESCDADLQFVLNSESLIFDLPDKELIKDYYNQEKACWNIDPKDYDVEAEPITLYLPTIAKDECIIDWARAMAASGQKIDETFIQFLPWLLIKADKNPTSLNRTINKLYKEYKLWSIDLFEFIDDVIKNISVIPSENLRTTCPNCGQEVRSSIRFQSGVKQLFQAPMDTAGKSRKKFGSR